MSLPSGSDVSCGTVSMNMAVAVTTDDKGLSTASCHFHDPSWSFCPSPLLEIPECPDMMDGYSVV
jgi:hypothetical protein